MLNTENAPLSAAQTAWLGTQPNTAPAQAWFAARETYLLAEWANLGLWPSTVAPTATPDGGTLSAGQTVTLSNPNLGGTIYYTMDGSDPREVGGTISSGAMTFTSPISIPAGGNLKARVLSGGTWSPLTEANYAPPLPQLAITELHYNPDGAGDATEFLEFRNIGASSAILDGAQFIDGITYTFGAGVSIGAGDRIVLVRDSVAFANAYPTVTITGQYEGALSNGGERIELVDALGNSLIVLDYGDDKVPGWPALADGEGRSLVLRDENNWTAPAEPTSWRSSFGSPTPGDTDVVTFSGDPAADNDGDDLPALVEHALGSSDGDPLDRGLFSMTTALAGGTMQCTVELRYDLRAADTALEPMFSTDNQTWQALPLDSELYNDADGSVTRTYLCPPGLRGFVQLRAMLQ